MKNKSRDIPDFDHVKLLSRIKSFQDRECWDWQGAIDRDGYGKISINRVQFMAHRVSYEVFNGGLSRDLLIDHKCRNRKCINPDHLKQVTEKINVLENSLSIQAKNSIKTHCNNGHEFTPDNTYNRRRSGGGRICRECILIRGKK